MNRKEKSPARPDDRQASSGSTTTEAGSVAVMHPQYDPTGCPAWCDGEHLHTALEDADGFHHDSRSQVLHPAANAHVDDVTHATDVSVSTSLFAGEHQAPTAAVVELHLDELWAQLTPDEARQLGTWLLEAASLVEAAAG